MAFNDMYVAFYKVSNLFVMINSRNGQISLKENAPDTITSFVTTALVINKNQGIGFTPKPIEVWQYFIILQKIMRNIAFPNFCYNIKFYEPISSAFVEVINYKMNG